MTLGLERSAETRATAEQALVWLLDRLPEHRDGLVVLGGLVPETLTDPGGSDAPQHLGTTDVDLLLISHVGPQSDLCAVEAALEGLDFDPKTTGGWRWSRDLGRMVVLIEFLCDLDDHRAGEIIRPPGCATLGALNLRGTGYVARDNAPRELVGLLPDGTERTLEANYAGLDGYLLSKCVAARTRGAVKDFYDLAYVLIHNDRGGPSEAARRLAQGRLADAVGPLRSTFLEVRARFGQTGDIGPSSYASEMRKLSPGADEARLRADAMVAVATFTDLLLA